MPKLNAARDLSAAKTGASMVDAKPDRLSRTPPELSAPNEHRAYLLGIDPGGGADKNGEIGHVGLTVAAMDRALPNGFKVLHCWEMTPEEFVPWFTVAAGMGVISHIVLERFKLRKDMAMSMVGSEFEVVQLIGWIDITVQQLNADKMGIGITRQLPGDRLGPVNKLMELAGMVHVSPKSPDHARSSEDHLMTYAFRSGLVLDDNARPIVLR